MCEKGKWYWGGHRKGWKFRLTPESAKEHGESLAAFWIRVKAKEPRLALLQEWAKKATARLQTYRDIRGFKPKYNGGGVCWSCQAQGRKLAGHHIIQVQHGGRNRRRNIVHICGECHAAVHPWLRGEKSPRTKVPDIVIPPPPMYQFDGKPRLVKTTA